MARHRGLKIWPTERNTGCAASSSGSTRRAPRNCGRAAALHPHAQHCAARRQALLDSPGGDNQHQIFWPDGVRTYTKRSNGRASRRCTSTVRSGHTIRVSTSSTSRQTSLIRSTTIYDEGRGQSKEGLAVRHDRDAPGPTDAAATHCIASPLIPSRCAARLAMGCTRKTLCDRWMFSRVAKPPKALACSGVPGDPVTRLPTSRQGTLMIWSRARASMALSPRPRGALGQVSRNS
jgi:hypothetical protein